MYGFNHLCPQTFGIARKKIIDVYCIFLFLSLFVCTISSNEVNNIHTPLQKNGEDGCE